MPCQLDCHVKAFLSDTASYPFGIHSAVKKAISIRIDILESKFFVYKVKNILLASIPPEAADESAPLV